MSDHVLVTTKHRGVFFGRRGDAELPSHITLHDARNCIYWDASCGGFMGLASIGPNKKCRIGERVNEITLYDVTSITPVADDAVSAWMEAETWKG